LEYIPGTTLPFNNAASEDCFSLISPLLTVTKGLTLAQVRELTGLETSTIQNWIKRGWVKNPTEKRYGEEQVMRIILINMMRGSMQMEQIAFLMSYINGSVEDRSDDILPDRELFNILCSIIYECEQKSVYDTNEIDITVEAHLENVTLRDDVSKTKLKTALRATVLAILSTRMRDLAQAAYMKLV
jgi:DNA-binding transcriptional MerR regulator